MDKMLVFDSTKCTGLKICELTCPMKRFGEVNPRQSYVRISKNKEMDLNVAALKLKCDFCEECVHACLPNAIKFIGLEEAYLKLKGRDTGIIPAPFLDL